MCSAGVVEGKEMPTRPPSTDAPGTCSHGHIAHKCELCNPGYWCAKHGVRKSRCPHGGPDSSCGKDLCRRHGLQVKKGICKSCVGRATGRGAAAGTTSRPGQATLTSRRGRSRRLSMTASPHRRASSSPPSSRSQRRRGAWSRRLSRPRVCERYFV